MQDLDLAVKIGDVVLEHPIMAGAGLVKDIDGVKEVAGSASSLAMLGSITMDAKTGNPGDIYYQGIDFSLNAIGLRNKGAEFYMNALPEMAAIAHQAQKPLAVSVAGFNVEEYEELSLIAQAGKADIIELNFGCPNVWGNDNTQKPIPTYRPEIISRVLDRLHKVIRVDLPLLVKLSPITDVVLLQEVAGVLNSHADEYKTIHGVTTMNTLPNSFAYNDKGRAAITVELAGMSGPAVKPIGLGQVFQLRKKLSQSLVIIGVGGISTGADVDEYIRAGAAAVQVVTAVYSDFHPLGRILDEYTDILIARRSENHG